MRRTLCAMICFILLPAAGLAQPYDRSQAPPLPDPVPGVLVPAPEGADVLLNGSFETNGGVGSSTFADWTVFDVPGSISGMPSTFGSVVAQTGTSTPISASTVDAPTDGAFAAMADSTGASSKVIYQDVAVPGSGATLSCDVYINNQNVVFINAGTLDWEAVANQHARLDLVDPAAPADDVGAGVLENLFITNPGDPAVQSYQTISADLAAYAGTTVRLRWAEADNQFFFNAGIDNCSVIAAPVVAITDVPTLGGGGIALLILLLVVAAVVVFARRS